MKRIPLPGSQPLVAGRRYRITYSQRGTPKSGGYLSNGAWRSPEPTEEWTAVEDEFTAVEPDLGIMVPTRDDPHYVEVDDLRVAERGGWRIMNRKDKITLVVLVAIVVALAVLAILLTSGCATRRIAYPISESHSQLTATDYDLAEAAFAGDELAPMPTELAAVRCQELLDKRDMAAAFTLGLTGLSGAGGLATLLPKDITPEEQKRWDLGLGVSTLAVGTAAVILGALVHSWSAEFEKECGTKEAPIDIPEHPAADEVDPVDAGVD